MHICAMSERAKIITEQALALSAEEREKLLIALAASLGRHPFDPLEDEDGSLSDEAKQYLQEAWDKGIASGPGKYASTAAVRRARLIHAPLSSLRGG
jgi:hypothetical protein